MTGTRSRGYLVGEWIVVFVALPAGAAVGAAPLPVLYPLWALALIGLFLLLHSATFDRRELWSARAVDLGPVLVRFAAVALLSLAAVLVSGRAEQAFPVARPRLWVALVSLYPFLSVVPQGIVYRCFVLDRYAALFGRGPKAMLASATAFALAHVVYRDAVAVGLAFAGGVLFARTHLRTRSLVVSSIEQALYGVLLFSSPLGSRLYDGSWDGSWSGGG